MSELDYITYAANQLTNRAFEMQKRTDYYRGRHYYDASESEAWRKSFKERMRGVVENNVSLVVDTRAEAVLPKGVTSEIDDKLNEAVSLIASKWLNKHANTWAEASRWFQGAGYDVSVGIGHDKSGNVIPIMLDPYSCFTKKTRAEEYEYAVYFWKEETLQEYTNVTLWLPGEEVHYRSNSVQPYPVGSSFEEVARYKHNSKEVMVASVGKLSIIDDLIPPSNELNRNKQHAVVAGEMATFRQRILLGFDLYDPKTGKLKKLTADINPATGARETSVPGVLGADGMKREVIELNSLEPGKFIAEAQDNRMTIARLGRIPAYMIQLSGNAPSGDALEIAAAPLKGAKEADERLLSPFYKRIIELFVQRSLNTTAELGIEFVGLSTVTSSSRIDQVVKAVGAGVPLEEALVIYGNLSREMAAFVADKQLQEQAELLQKQSEVFLAGTDVEDEQTEI